MPELSGVVTYRQRIALPAGARVRIRLEDTARQDVAATLVAETEVVTQGEQVPVPFTLTADLSRAAEHAHLSLRATIEVDGELRFATTSHVPFSPYETELIELVLDAVSASPPSLGYTEWTLVELGGDPVRLAEGERAPQLVLDLEESRVAGSGGVNRIIGTFALDANELRFGPLATTLMAGSDPVMQRERAFLDALARVTSYELGDRTLALHADGDVVARLAALV